MSNFSQIIRAIQRDAADLSDDTLRGEIIAGLTDMDDAITCLYGSRPGVTPDMDHVAAVSGIMSAVLVVALYVRELTTRPVIWAEVSAN